ncbi:MAG: hypothetical protein K1X88_35170 [Nannocystaceae bacterium]|nr:hypothetical protein [Nannocystaceae bacterium]
MPRSSLVVVAALAGACVLGFRGEAELTASHDLAGVRSVRIDLPSTPMTITACDPDAPGTCPEALRYDGRVLATGGSDRDARRHALAPALVFERDGGLGWLQAEIPLAVRGLVDLELAAIELPSDRDLEVRTDLGDIDIASVRGYVSVEVDRGDVEIDGGDAGVAVALGVGDIVVHTAGDADLRTEHGRIALTQRVAGRDAIVHAGGAVALEQPALFDVEYDIATSGTIRITTAAVVAIADGHLRRRVGNGAVRVEIRAEGDVAITEP